MQYTFVTGMGRSGTSFLGKLLAHADGIDARHEFIGSREFDLLSYYIGEDYARPKLEAARISIDATSKSAHFVDVNGYLPHATQYLKDTFPDCRIFHLVRNPKKVVPSLYVRRDDRNVHLVPKSREDVEAWNGYSKLEQICWNWTETTQKLIDEGHPILRLEDIIDDFERLETDFLKPTGIALSRNDWKAVKSKKVNKTRPKLWRYAYARYKGKPFVEDTIPAYKDWKAEQKAALKSICGPTMEFLGY